MNVDCGCTYTCKVAHGIWFGPPIRGVVVSSDGEYAIVRNHIGGREYLCPVAHLRVDERSRG